jgi:hypothetical protein
MMQLFRTDRYTLTDVDASPQLSTPLGNLGRQYVINSGSHPLQQQRRCYRHSSGDCAIYQWTAPGCALEELLVAFTSPKLALSPDINCQAVVGRLKAVASGQTFDAELSWLPGYRWVEGIGEPGEGLEARSWVDEVWNVVVGTEDSEYLAGRSRAERWMPRRLAAYFETHAGDVVHVRHDSLSIHFPELESGECCQFQFVIASGSRQYSDAIWLAADQQPALLLAAGDCE